MRSPCKIGQCEPLSQLPQAPPNPSDMMDEDDVCFLSAMDDMFFDEDDSADDVEVSDFFATIAPMKRGQDTDLAPRRRIRRSSIKSRLSRISEASCETRCTIN
mmetsp:Transcript_68239/g.108286  ORF Transcript_68239/g.108286 Transcript_68239/m.108286 type:complete len:103 (-) Transcript_68239:115-423(-)